MSFVFETTCQSVPQSRVHLLHEMEDRAREVTYETVRRNLGTEALRSVFEGCYTWGPGRRKGLRMKNDRHIQYYRSRYDGKVCYDVDWSSIDHIWVKH